MYKKETTIPLLNIDPVDLRNSPDFTLLYGSKIVLFEYITKTIDVKAEHISLENNKFIMFPSTNMYYLTNNQKDI